jgi:hypothetical protein
MKNFIKSKFIWAAGIGVIVYLYPFIPGYFSAEALEEARVHRNALNEVVKTNATAVVSTVTDQYRESVAAQHQAAQEERELQLAEQEQQRKAELDAQQAPVREVADSVRVLASGVAQMGGNFNATLGDVNGRVTNLEQSIGGLNSKLDSLVELVAEKNTTQSQPAPVSQGQVTGNNGARVVTPSRSNCPPNCDCVKGSVHYGSARPVGNNVHSYRIR